jgi:AraC-like DNA-binding protein/quercetin dioxygenase-like cupin family protein
MRTPTVKLEQQDAPHALLPRALRRAELLCVNYLDAPPGEATGHHLHPRTMHVTCAISGGGNCEIDGVSQRIEPGLLHVVYPGVMHRFVADTTEPYTKYIVKFRIPDLMPRIFAGTIRLGRRRRPVQRCLQAMHARFAEARGAADAVDLRLSALVLQLLAEMRELSIGQPDTCATVQPATVTDPFAIVLNELQRPPFDYPGIDAMAARTGTSRRSFTNRFRAATGLPPFQFFQTVRLSYARTLVDEGQLLWKEIARECGFSNTQNLQRALKRHDASAATPTATGGNRAEYPVSVSTREHAHDDK